MRAVTLITLLAAAAFAGCITEEPATDDLPTDIIVELLAGPALWTDPQNAPHPMYNWPTLSNPIEGEGPAHWAAINGTALPDPVSALGLLTGAPEGVASGAGIAMFGSIMYIPGFGPESYVVDVSDPTTPTLTATIATDGSERGAAIIAYPNGRLVAAVSTGKGFNVQEITDPYAPETIAQVETPQGGHKLGIVPGTPILYNANSNGGGLRADQGTGVTEIYDLSDPASPLLVQEFPNGFGCHHIYFWNDAAQNKSRAICAGIEFAQIWDTADPKAPSVIVSVPIPHGNPMAPSPSVVPVITPFAHFSVLNNAGDILVVGDEFGGGGLPPGCAAGVDTPVFDPSTPIGALWFYDVSDETSPELLGWYSPGINLVNAVGSCTAHHGRLIPVVGRDLLAMAFYNSGVVLLDFTDPRMPNMIDQFAPAGVNIWESWYNNGYLFTGDLNQGMHVLELK